MTEGDFCKGSGYATTHGSFYLFDCPALHDEAV